MVSFALKEFVEDSVNIADGRLFQSGTVLGIKLYLNESVLWCWRINPS